MAEAVVSELAKTAIGLFFDIVDVLISLLPSAPFRIMLSQLSEDSGINVLGYVNYFIPFKFCATCINAWLACVPEKVRGILPILANSPWKCHLLLSLCSSGTMIYFKSGAYRFLRLFVQMFSFSDTRLKSVLSSFFGSMVRVMKYSHLFALEMV